MSAPIWKRLDMGYMRSDGEWFLERGARMTHGSNAWLIHRRVTGDRIGRDGLTAFDTKNGAPLWAVEPGTGHTTTVDADDTETPLYAHEYDAGWLSEAKAVVAQVEECAS